jgi:hypothetical protein
VDEEQLDLRVLVHGEQLLWTLSRQRPAGTDLYALRLTDDQGRVWEASGGDVFAALTNLRLQLEPEGVQICCNGARRNAWASGMQRDMASGLAVYLLQLGQHGGPPFARTLDPAPCDECGTVAEQRAFFEQWRAERA